MIEIDILNIHPKIKKSVLGGYVLKYSSRKWIIVCHSCSPKYVLHYPICPGCLNNG